MYLWIGKYDNYFRQIIVKNENAQDAEDKSPIVDPANSKIITTWEERQLLAIAKEILPDDAEIEENDTESYYAVIYESKKNRWIFRYYSDRKYPVVTLPFEITEQNKIDIERSGLGVFFGANQYIKINKVTDLLRISWLILQSYDYCSDDENFKRK